MQCPQCQHDNPTGVKFCGECGARLELLCSSCKATNPPGNKFCHECGNRLSGAPAPAVPRAPAPEAYTPQHLAERILTSRAALEGERKQVTVLFADLKGSMELLADRDPEEARAILDPVLERMMEAVHRYEGTVNQVMGDGIMALFGAPLSHEDHAVRACYAALRMQEAVKQYAEAVFRSHGLRIQIRVGLNSGEVVVRSIGSDLRMDYTAVGQITHLAARMEQTALPGSILLAPDTLRLVEGYVQVNDLGPVPVKGLAEPVPVYELIGAGLTRTRLQAAAARGLTRFVGREAELETLRRTLDRVAAGHGQIVALVGEPGVGKSRLTWEFTHSHRVQGWLMLESVSVSYGKATAYLPVIDLLKGYCGIEARDDPRRVREKVLGKLLALDRALEPVLPALLALLDVPAEDAAWEALDPPQRRQRTLEALKHLLLRESQEQPLLLVFEDLHWIDSETQALLDSLVDSLPTARILFLVNYRPEYDHTWHRKTYYQQLRLDPLPPESAEELLAALLGDEDELAPLERVLIERTEGNPFFIEESVRALIESGVLAGERGSYRLVKPFESAQVPVTVQAVLAARIDRLAPENKRLLQAAAVIGKDVPFRLLHGIAELREEWLRQGLAELQAAEFLYETSLFPDLEYTFKHALTHEVAYGSLLHERRRALHARIVGAIEMLYAGRLAEQVERLAQHAVRGECWDKAVRYLREAAAKAESRTAYREAIGYLEQALAAIEHLPESRETLEQALATRLDLRTSLWALGEYEPILAHLQAAEALAERLDDQRQLAQVCLYLSSHSWLRGHHERGRQSGERALAIAAALGDFGIETAANVYLGYVYFGLGDYPRAAAILARNVEALQGKLARERFGLASVAAVTSRGWMAVSVALLGRFAEAIALGEEASELAEAAGHRYSCIAAANHLGAVYLLKGDIGRTITVLEQNLTSCRDARILSLLPAITARLGRAYAQAGRVSEALSLLDETAAQIGSRDAHVAFYLAELGAGFFLTDRRAEAKDYAERGLALARDNKDRGTETWVLQLLGDLAAHEDPLDAQKAEGHYRAALTLAEELGMRPLVAHCHLGLGTLYRKIGRDEQARAELARAIELYRAMEMTYWLERAELASAQLY